MERITCATNFSVVEHIFRCGSKHRATGRHDLRFVARPFYTGVLATDDLRAETLSTITELSGRRTGV